MGHLTERAGTAERTPPTTRSRRRTRRRVARAAAAAIAAGILLAPPSAAVPGPDQGASDFYIFVRDAQDEYSNTRFDVADGWDFGDRVGYTCAWVEYFRSGSELFEVHFELVEGYPVPAKINDRFGAEAGDGNVGDLCGNGGGAGAKVAFDGSDHFPHGTALDFYVGGQSVVTLDYFDAPCARGYWTPGDQPGEAWLWWDEDGPTNNGQHDLDCDGGPGEPAAVVRAFVRNMGSGVGVCTEDSIGGWECKGATPAEHRSTITLRLKGNLRAVGRVRSGDGTAACVSGRMVTIQRRHMGHWMGVKMAEVKADGRFSVRIPDQSGRYRAVVLASTLANAEICQAATSPRRVNQG
jgi:hypothetical protein